MGRSIGKKEKQARDDLACLMLFFQPYQARQLSKKLKRARKRKKKSKR